VDETLRIVKSFGEGDLEWCARLMSESEPWITLRRTYDQCQTSVRRPDREVYLLLINDRRAGFLILCMTGAFAGYIQTICIAPEWRGRGIGTKALALAEERIFSESPNVFMCVSSFNEDAKGLYLRLGYEIVGSLKDYIVRGHDEILLRKTRGPLSEFVPRT
jgi:ribosomal protein S18 acetylase RimI-like enzyme